MLLLAKMNKISLVSFCSTSVLLLSSQDLEGRMKSLQVSPLCSWIPFSQIGWISYEFCWHWLPQCLCWRERKWIHCVGGGKADLYCFKQEVLSSFPASVFLGWYVAWWELTKRERSWEIPLHKANAFAVPRAVLIPALPHLLVHCRSWGVKPGNMIHI